MPQAMPLSLTSSGSSYSVTSVHGDEDTQRHLETLGFVPGAAVDVVSQTAGQVIVKVKDARMGLNAQTARRIYVE